MRTKLFMIISLTVVAFSFLLGITIGRTKSKENSEMTDITNIADTTRKAERVFNLIILDESGSMSGLERTSVNGVNETIQTIKSAFELAPEQKQFITFLTFSDAGDSSFRTRIDMEEIPTVKEYSLEDYSPSGTTPLYDAMGISLTNLEQKVTENDIVLVTIITDGYENSSKEYDSEMIKALVNRLDEKDWVFTYIGANQDAVLEAGRIGIHNAMNYNADERGVREMWKKENSSRLRFMEGARTGTAKERLKRNYFNDEK